MRTNGKVGSSLTIQEHPGHIAQIFSSDGELEWVSTSLPTLQNTPERHEGSETAIEIKDSHMGNMKIVPNPPDLDAWRERLFNVDGPITLTEEQYVQTLFLLL